MSDVKNHKQARPLSAIRSGLISRGVSLAKLTIGSGSRLASHQINKLLSQADDAADESMKKLLLSQARLLVDELGQLKGSLMKAGQMLSMYGEHFLPPEANEILKSLQFQSPPLEWRLIDRVLTQELGREKLAALKIDPVPLASASLGQVHKAKVIATGQEVAIKVQYPDVDKAIENDLKAIKTLFAAAKLLPQIPHLGYLFDEIKSMLHQEVDYRQERVHTQAFKAALGNDPRFVVPEVFPEFSTAKVLTTSYCEGLPVDSREVQALSLARRNRLAASALDLYLTELFALQMVQTDPHLGNYRIQIDPDGNDRLVLLDFGAVRRFPQNFVSLYKEMSRGALERDEGHLKEAALGLGFLEPGDPEHLQQLFKEFCYLMTEPFSFPDVSVAARPWFNDAGEYDFKNTDVPKRLTRLVGEIVTSFKMRSPPQEVVFLDRKTGGVFIFMGVLGARLDPKPILEPYFR